MSAKSGNSIGPLELDERIRRQIDFIERQTGKRPDSLWLVEDEFDAFVREVSKTWYTSPQRYFRDPSPDDLVFDGIPIKRFRVEK
jgi:hypothetical protein